MTSAPGGCAITVWTRAIGNYLVRSSRMGRVSIAYLSDSKFWVCGRCGTHVTRHEDIVSKHFQGTLGAFVAFAIFVDEILSHSLFRTNRTRILVQLRKQRERAPPTPSAPVPAHALAGFVWPRGAPRFDDW
jgi:hypothetical protein